MGKMQINSQEFTKVIKMMRVGLQAGPQPLRRRIEKFDIVEVLGVVASNSEGLFEVSVYTVIVSSDQTCKRRNKLDQYKFIRRRRQFF